MKHETVSVKSPCDGLALSALAVIPDAEKEMRGIVQLVHGMSEHKTRYINFMEFLADHGFLCIIHDHRGHGKSVKSTADLGYFYGAGGSGLVEDTLAVNQYARSRWPGLPVCLLGHSMGSLVARAFTKQHDDLIDGLILIGCPSKNPGVKAGLLLVRIIKLLCGGRHKSLLLDKLAIPRSKNRNAVSAAEWISSMESVI